MSEQAPVSTPDGETTETKGDEQTAASDEAAETTPGPVTTGAEAVVAALEAAGAEKNRVTVDVLEEFAQDVGVDREVDEEEVRV